MTSHDHDQFQDRVRKLAEQAMEWEGQPDPYACPADRPCSCPTCGIVNARLRGELVARGWSPAAVHHVRVEGYDFRGGCDPYLAAVKVDSNEVARAYHDLNELLDSEVLSAIERILRRSMC